MSTEAQPPAGSARATAVAHPYGQGKRAFYGTLWTLWTVGLTIAGCTVISGASVFTGLLLLALAGVTLRYTYRIWTWQARRLIFFIVF
ncbi:hypothetical protein [Amycolatopsis sp. H20-H5]|uniref:hypothetical protein n=1 Tax=Amycolatopsis sp. H20-H5 TaxID=3046309 RepID=UPI002DB69FF1|nr:hypothetical protein [Amycolatopsis sp. H20-H5]MEC3982143.1 hypothetical protein [Amycolatopsis sp. H20-H5]